MALKDWEERVFDDRKFGYERKDNENINLFFYEENGKWKLFQNTKHQKRFKTFQTKSQALSYARSYMRSH